MDKLTKDILIIEAILADDPIAKNAQSGILSSLFNKTKDYAKDQIKEDDKVGSIINLLAPGILWISGFKTISLIANVAIHWFGFDLGKIFEEIASGIKSLITGDKKTSSSNVESVVKRAVENNFGEQPTEQDLSKAQLSSVSELELEDVILYKSAINQLKQEEIIKQAQLGRSLFRFRALKSTTGSVLINVLKWIVMAVLAAGGFLLADEAADWMLGTNQKTKSPHATTPNEHISIKPSTQTLLKENPNYVEEKFNINSHWIESVPPNQIAGDIMEWAKEIYPDLAGHETEVENSTSFNNVVKYIQNYNRTNTTDITFIPKDFTSRKQVVDEFIDEAAQKLQGQISTTPSKVQSIPLAQPSQKPKMSEPL